MVSEERVHLPAGAGPHSITNETLPIGLPQARFPGAAGRPGARGLLESPSEQHMSSVALPLLCTFIQARPPPPSDWIAASMVFSCTAVSGEKC